MLRTGNWYEYVPSPIIDDILRIVGDDGGLNHVRGTCTALRSVVGSIPNLRLTLKRGVCTIAMPKHCNVTRVSLHTNPVDTLLPLAECITLQVLDCNGTKVTDLSPLAKCVALTTLDCSWTNVTDLSPLAKCIALRELNVWHTKVSDISSHGVLARVDITL